MNKRITGVKKLQEFVNDNITCGTYLVTFNSEDRVFVRNGDSVGVVTYYYNASACKCVSEIRNDVKEELFQFLKTEEEE